MKEKIIIAKDSQIDSKQIRKEESKDGPTMAENALDGESRNTKHQSGPISPFVSTLFNNSIIKFLLIRQKRRDTYYVFSAYKYRGEI